LTAIVKLSTLVLTHPETRSTEFLGHPASSKLPENTILVVPRVDSRLAGRGSTAPIGIETSNKVNRVDRHKAQFSPLTHPQHSARGKRNSEMNHQTRRYQMTALATCLAWALTTTGIMPTAFACSRAAYLGPNGIVITTRSNDWYSSQHSNLWIYPRGLERNGNAGANSLKWTSKFGSVTVAGWDAATIDGINEKGLVANLLYLAESDYGKPAANNKALSLSAWGQYVLDNFATVEEAIDALRQEPFSIAAPNDRPERRFGRV